MFRFQLPFRRKRGKTTIHYIRSVCRVVVGSGNPFIAAHPHKQRNGASDPRRRKNASHGCILLCSALEKEKRKRTPSRPIKARQMRKDKRCKQFVTVPCSVCMCVCFLVFSFLFFYEFQQTKGPFQHPFSELVCVFVSRTVSLTSSLHYIVSTSPGQWGKTPCQNRFTSI